MGIKGYDPDLEDTLAAASSILRARDAYYSKETPIWLDEGRMCQTEVGLRLAAALLSHRIAAGPVSYIMAGYELTRRENPQFPARRFLTQRLGFTAADENPDEWRGFYTLKGCPHPLGIDWNRHAGQVITTLTSGQRLVAFVTAGLLRESRSPAEHKNFWQVIGRAATWSGSDATDILAVCVPRSERYRKLAAEYRQSEGMRRSRIAILLMGSMGDLHGAQELSSRPD